MFENVKWAVEGVGSMVFWLFAVSSRTPLGSRGSRYSFKSVGPRGPGVYSALTKSLKTKEKQNGTRKYPRGCLYPN